MKTVILDPLEQGDPSTEEIVIYSLCKKTFYQGIDAFFFSTLGTNAYVKDDRWYQKKDGALNTILHDKLQHIFHTHDDLKNIALQDVERVMILVQDWDEFDYVLEGTEYYVRINLVYNSIDISQSITIQYSLSSI